MLVDGCKEANEVSVLPDIEKSSRVPQVKKPCVPNFDSTSRNENIARHSNKPSHYWKYILENPWLEHGTLVKALESC